jgi:proliferating cell nuclear antigen PCNA
MFEAQLTEGKTFKHIIEAIKDLVGDCNLDCSEEEIAIQSMDSAHVSLVAVRLGSEAFENFRCDRPNSLGISTSNMDKILKMLGDKDTITFKAEDDKPDTLTMLFESTNDDGPIADFGECFIKKEKITKLVTSIVVHDHDCTTSLSCPCSRCMCTTLTFFFLKYHVQT